MSIWMWILIGLLVFFILGLAMRRYIKGLLMDALDLVLSFADNFFAGVGAVGLDFGDWIAAFIIFTREKNVTNKFAAGLVAWEATNFIPLSFIPGFGEVLEVICGLTPSAFLARLLFAKFGKAEKEEKKLAGNEEVAEKAGIDTKNEKAIIQRVKALIESAPVTAIEEADLANHEIAKKLITHVNRITHETKMIIEQIANQAIEAPQELIDMLQQAINISAKATMQAEHLAQEENFKKAVETAQFAHDTMLNAINQFNTAFVAVQQGQEVEFQ